MSQAKQYMQDYIEHLLEEEAEYESYFYDTEEALDKIDPSYRTKFKLSYNQEQAQKVLYSQKHVRAVEHAHNARLRSIRSRNNQTFVK